MALMLQIIIMAAREEISKPKRFKRERKRRELPCLHQTMYCKLGREGLAGVGFSFVNSYMIR